MSNYRQELLKAVGIIKGLLTHTLHSGSLHRPDCHRKACCGYRPNEKSPTYRLYSRRKEAGRRFVAKWDNTSAGEKPKEADQRLKQETGLLARLFFKAVGGDVKRIDHACEKCPGATLRGQGFLCAYHEAEIRLTEVGALPAAAPEEKP